MRSSNLKQSSMLHSWVYSLSSVGRGVAVLFGTVYLRMHEKLDSTETVAVLGALALGHSLPKLLGKTNQKVEHHEP